MSKVFVVQFGAGNPITNSGLTCTFLQFNVIPGGATTPPGITEVNGQSSGLYYFFYEPPPGPTSAIAFVIDGATSSLGNNRYVSGSIDPLQAVDERLGFTLNAIGNTLLAIGQSFTFNSTAILAGIGTLADSFGSTVTDPTTIFGYLKRLQEFNEGNSVFNKTSGNWAIWSRGNTYTLGASTYAGSSAQIASKTVLDNGSTVTKG